MWYPGDDHAVCRRCGSPGFLCAQVYPPAEDPQSHKVSRDGVKYPRNISMSYYSVTRCHLPPVVCVSGTGSRSVISWPLSLTPFAPLPRSFFFFSSSLSFSHSWACRFLEGSLTSLTTEPGAATLTTSLRP